MMFFDKQKTGEAVGRLSSDTTVLQNAMSVNISMLVRSTAGYRRYCYAVSHIHKIKLIHTSSNPTNGYSHYKLWKKVKKI